MQEETAPQIASTKTLHLAVLVATGAVRPGEGPRYLPNPTKRRGAGRDAASYVAESRR